MFSDKSIHIAPQINEQKTGGYRIIAECSQNEISRLDCIKNCTFKFIRRTRVLL